MYLPQRTHQPPPNNSNNTTSSNTSRSSSLQQLLYDRPKIVLVALAVVGVLLLLLVHHVEPFPPVVTAFAVPSWSRTCSSSSSRTTKAAYYRRKNHVVFSRTNGQSLQHAHDTTTSTTSSTKEEGLSTGVMGIPYDPNLLYMGISQELDELPKGRSLFKKIPANFLTSTTSTTSSSSTKPTTAREQDRPQRWMEIQKLSQRPPLFVLKNVLSRTECDRLVNYCRNHNSSRMELAETRIGGADSLIYRQKSRMTWISNHHNQDNHHQQQYNDTHVDTHVDEKEDLLGINLESLARSIHGIFLPFEPSLFQLPRHHHHHPHRAAAGVNTTTTTSTSVPSASDAAAIEDLQVVHYETQGQYRFHHDGARRLLTVIYYLNGVSGTHFPLADYGRRVMSREEALQVVATTNNDATTGGVLVSTPDVVQQGDAVAFYNYFQDATVEWNAIHAGLPAQSDKWIATHWYHHVPYQQPE